MGKQGCYSHILLVKCDVLNVLGKKFDIHLKKKYVYSLAQHFQPWEYST